MKRGPSRKLPRNALLVGDVRRRLDQLEAASVDCVLTSPPYFLLRDYGITGQIGLEANVEMWVDELRLVMRGLVQVLKPTGTVWLNLGDTFSRHSRLGAPRKSLLLGPERLALGLLEDGWAIRNKIVWAKTNGMPASANDRLTSTWEVLYLLTRGPTYHFDLDAIRIPHTSVRARPSADTPNSVPRGRPAWAGPFAGNNSGLARLRARGLAGHPGGKNPGDVWTLPAANFRGQHFATFPPALVERVLLAACPERTCQACGRPWKPSGGSEGGLRPLCRCGSPWRPGLVLDPFFGAGTVGLVAERLGREWLGIELNAAFARMASERIEMARSNRQGPADTGAA